jgi:DNA repair photolyase
LGQISGTREWAVAEINCSLGCPHDCRYCYARYDAVTKRKLLTTEQWKICREIPGVDTQYPLFDGRVMFPTAHDIVSENIQQCTAILRALLDSGNSVLIVSKPHLDIIRQLCQSLEADKKQILFRFTITARRADILSFWEPGAPGYKERFDTLYYAFENGFETSVSVEPILDMSDVASMVREMLPLITDTIWLGRMNKIQTRVEVDSPQVLREVDRIREGQEDSKIRQLYDELKDLDKIRWKESIKEVVGLTRAEKPGLDI